MKKILVTGSSGFIGRYTLDLLQQAGYLICPLRLNLANPATIEQRVRDFQAETLLHLAWETTPGQYWHCPTNLEWLKASLSLVEAFAKHGGKRVVIAGSCAEKHPTTTYGACKEALRLSAEAFLKRAQVSFAWGRIFFPYGPYEKQARMIPSAIRALLSQQPFRCSSQDHVRDFLFIEDMHVHL